MADLQVKWLGSMFVVELVSHFVSQQECVSIVNGYENYNDAYIFEFIYIYISRVFVAA